MTRHLIRFAAAACVFFVTPLIPAVAQQKPAAQEPPVFGEELDVRVVNVEAVVTDKDGNRVPGLKPGDFRLRVDGKDVPVEYFTEVREGRSTAPASGEETVQSAAPEGAVGTHYLVFIDDFFSPVNERNAVLKAFRADLARLAPEDRMAVVAYDGGRITMFSNWTDSRQMLEQAFDRAMARPSHGFERAAERRNLLSDEALYRRAAGKGSPDFSTATAAGLSDRERAYGANLVRQIEGSVRAGVSAMRGFAGPRGRKVLLLLSGGWPASVQSYIRGSERLSPTRDLPEGEDLLSPLTRTANLLGYTLYPVDVPGTQEGGIGEQEIEGSLYFLARETGGRPVLNDNRTRALASASGDTRSYYWLGFSPTWKRDDRSHEVKVEARRPGLEIRSRTNFLDLSRSSEVSMKLESTLLFGSFPGAVALPIQLGKPVRTPKGLEIPLSLELPTSLMTAVQVGEGQYATQLELRFAASDADGNGSAIPVVPVHLSGPKPHRDRFVRYDTRLTLPARTNHLVVAVYDPPSGRMATAQVDFAETKKSGTKK